MLVQIMLCLIFTKEVGITNGKPVTAFTIYEFLVRWRFLEAERTNLFDRLLFDFSKQIPISENATDDN